MAINPDKAPAFPTGNPLQNRRVVRIAFRRCFPMMSIVPRLHWMVRGSGNAPIEIDGAMRRGSTFAR